MYFSLTGYPVFVIIPTDLCGSSHQSYTECMSKKLTKYEVANSIPDYAAQCAQYIWKELTKFLTEVSKELEPDNRLHLELALISKDLYAFHLIYPQNQSLEIEELVLNMFPEGKAGYYSLEIQDYKQAIFTSVARKEKPYFGLMARLLHRVTDGKYLEYTNNKKFMSNASEIYELFNFETTTASALQTGGVLVDFEATI